jgi:hypothetical protein
MPEKNSDQEMQVKVYLDVCCLCRPFDDQQNKKIRLETEAILAILDRCTRDWELIGSVVIDDEVSLIPDIERRLKVEQKLKNHQRIHVSSMMRYSDRHRSIRKPVLNSMTHFILHAHISGKLFFSQQTIRLSLLPGKTP